MCGGDPWVRRPPPHLVQPLWAKLQTSGTSSQEGTWRRVLERNIDDMKTIHLCKKTEYLHSSSFTSSEGLKLGLRCLRMFPKCPRFFFSSACKIKSVTHLRTAPIECPSLLKFSWYRSAGRYSWKAHILNMCILSEILGDHLILFSRPGLAVRSSR